MRLTKVQRTLRKIGVEFDYKEGIMSSAEITFKDSLGVSYEIKEAVFLNNVILMLNDYTFNTQQGICDWLNKNIELLTDKEAFEKKESEEKRIRDENERRTEVIDVQKTTFGNYELEISTIGTGRKYYSISILDITINRYTAGLYVERTKENEVEITMQTTSYGSLSLQESLKLIKAMEEATEAIIYFECVLRNK